MKFITIVVLLTIMAVASAMPPKTEESHNIESYIINGEDIEDTVLITFYAYLEIFRQSNFSGPMYFGGGTFINSKIILTVGQNLEGFSSWRIGLGAARISEMQWSYSTDATIHPEYNSTTLAHNIGVIHLSSAIILSQRIIPISGIPTDNMFPMSGIKLHIVGFGFGVMNKQPSVLQQSSLTVMSDEDCAIAYPHLLQIGQLEHHFCARNYSTNSNICAGDQGGPIYERDSNILVGLQSFHRIEDCRNIAAQPPAFLKVGRYNLFINSFV